jgi:hypothetical protein
MICFRKMKASSDLHSLWWKVDWQDMISETATRSVTSGSKTSCNSAGLQVYGNEADDGFNTFTIIMLASTDDAEDDDNGFMRVL